MVKQRRCIVFLRSPRHVKEEGNRILLRLEVTHVQDPELVDAIFISKLHLLPEVLYRGDVQPFGISRGAYVVNVVVHAPTAFVLPFLLIRKFPDIAPVVIRNEYDDVIRHTQSLFIIQLDFLVKSPDLRPFLRRLACDLAYDLALVPEQALHHADNVLIAAGQGCVAVAPHAYGDEVLIVLGPLDTLTEEPLQFLLVLRIVPHSAICLRVARPFLVVSGHRLVVRGSHHYAHLVSRLAVERIVGIESPTPHRRPEEIATQTQNQLENVGVELMSAPFGTVVILHPGRKARSLVVQEQTAIPHRRFPCRITAFLYGYVIVMFNRGVRPEIPRRHAYLLTELVDAVYRTSPVASCNDQSLFHTLERMLDHGQEVLLVLSGKLAAVDFPFGDEFGNMAALRTPYHYHPFCVSLCGNPGLIAADCLEVPAQGLYRNSYRAIVLRVGQNCGRNASTDYGETPGGQAVVGYALVVDGIHAHSGAEYTKDGNQKSSL